VAQPGSALRSGRRGPQFKSGHPDWKRGNARFPHVAQASRQVTIQSVRGGPQWFWAVWIVALVAVLVGYLVDWLNTGAFAGAYALLVALAATQHRGRGRPT
jgi:hypothetical protein